MLKMANKEITKAQFEAAVNKYPPAKWIKFTFKYFSASAEKGDLKVSHTLVNIMLVAFVVMLFGAAFNVATKYLVPFIIIYCGILIPLVILMFLAATFNNRRHDKIRKELGGITIGEYEKLVYKFNP
jgi:uncharacterized membrane protein